MCCEPNEKTPYVMKYLASLQHTKSICTTQFYAFKRATNSQKIKLKNYSFIRAFKKQNTKKFNKKIKV